MLSLVLTASALADVISVSSSPNVVIPELGVGLVTPLSVSGVSAGMIIQDLNVQLNIGPAAFPGNSAWNGDFYAQLTHVDPLGNAAMSVLLNRVGRGQGGLHDADGYGGNGFAITLDDQAPTDVHWNGFNGPGPLTGSWQADGRLLDPSAAPGLFPGDPRGGRMNTFNGMDANGDWYLYLYDAAGGNVGQINSWGLEITVSGAAVPDSSLGGVGLSAILLVSLLGLGRRRTWRAAT